MCGNFGKDTEFFRSGLLSRHRTEMRRDGANFEEQSNEAVFKILNMNGADVQYEANELGLTFATGFTHDILEMPTHRADRCL